MKNSPYKCVSCSFYDKLEALAIYHKKVDLTYLNEKGETQKQQTVFKNFKSIDKEEFVVLGDNSLLRLDKILNVEEI